MEIQTSAPSAIEKHVLTFHEKSVIDTLPPFHAAMVKLRLEKPFKSYQKPKIKEFCLVIMAKSFMEQKPTGIPSQQILNTQAEFLVKELDSKYGELTVSEVTTAFSEGIRGVTGPYFGMCPKTYNQFLKHFYELKVRSEAWAKYLDGIENLKFSEKPKVFTREYLAGVSKSCFTDYKESGKLPYVPHAIYDTIKELMGVSTLIDKLDWEAIKEEVKTTLEKRHKTKAGSKNLNEVLNMESRTWEFEVKKVGLRYYFDNLINAGKNLEL